MKNNKHLATTRKIAKKGFSGMHSSSLASISLYLESAVQRNPLWRIASNEMPEFMFLKAFNFSGFIIVGKLFEF